MTKHKKLTVMTIALLCVIEGLSAQEKKSIILSDRAQVELSSNSSKQLDGPYLVTMNKNVVLRGAYKANARTGNWYAFNDKEKLFLRYNYDQKKVLYVDSVSINRIDVKVLSTDPIIKEKASIPVPISSIDQYVSLLGTELRRLILKDNKNADGILIAELITEIDKEGKPRYSATYKTDGIDVKTRLVIKENDFKLEWIPASYEGTTLPSIFSVTAKIDFTEKIPGRQRFIWNY
jgi:hypothetical protein